MVRLTDRRYVTEILLLRRKTTTQKLSFPVCVTVCCCFTKNCGKDILYIKTKTGFSYRNLAILSFICEFVSCKLYSLGTYALWRDLL